MESLTNVSARPLPIWSWDESGTCTLDAVLLFALLFTVSHPPDQPKIQDAVKERSGFRISPFTNFNRKLEFILSKHGSWDNIPPIELTTLRNQVRLQLEKNGVNINHESDLSGVLDQLLLSRFRTFSMNRINRCSKCGNRENPREPVERDTVYVHILRYIAASGLGQLRLENMIDFQVKVKP